MLSQCCAAVTIIHFQNCFIIPNWNCSRWTITPLHPPSLQSLPRLLEEETEAEEVVTFCSKNEQVPWSLFLVFLALVPPPTLSCSSLGAAHPHLQVVFNLKHRFWQTRRRAFQCQFSSVNLLFSFPAQRRRISFPPIPALQGWSRT